jgi:hypothetical protein
MMSQLFCRFGKNTFVGLALVFAVVAFIAKQDAIYDCWRYGSA